MGAEPRHATPSSAGGEQVIHGAGERCGSPDHTIRDLASFGFPGSADCIHCNETRFERFLPEVPHALHVLKREQCPHGSI